MFSPQPALQLPLPDDAALAHSGRLIQQLRGEIAARGQSLPFSRFMEMVLYAPGMGYYSAGARKFGAAGDFVTAPEISALFSRCVARQCRQVLEKTGGSVLELGAGSGAMAGSILRELEALGSMPTHYHILEVSAELRQRQRQTLAGYAERVVWLEALPNRFDGVIVANEVMDALPVERFRVTAAGLRALHVAWQNGEFVWCEAPLSGANALPAGLPLGYESEYNLRLAPWLASLSDSLGAGLILLIDYGYPRREYYHPERRKGTLVCHYRHRVHSDPLLWPGLQDISASVDFTAAAETGRRADLRLAGYTRQAYFLFACGLQEMLAEVSADDPRYWQLAGQVKRLTLPAEMGERFKVLALTRGFDEPLRGFTLMDERERL